MEIDITAFLQNSDAYDFSASVAERGPTAGRDTWNNALAEGASSPLLTTEEQLAAFRDDMRGYGAWTDEEIDAWSARECNALFTQLVSGDIREAGLDDDFFDEIDWPAYEAACEAGRYSGSIYRGDDGRVYYYLGM